MLSLVSRLVFAGVVFIICSPLAFASSDKIQWHLYLVAITILSSIASVFIIKRKKSIETFGIKVLIWGTYFWVFTFAQLTLLAILYYFYG